MKEPIFKKSYVIEERTINTKIIYNSFWEHWELHVNKKGMEIFENRDKAFKERNKRFKVVNTHSFYKGKISNTFENKILIVAENNNKLLTNTFKIAKEFAIKNQLEIQFELF